MKKVFLASLILVSMVVLSACNQDSLESKTYDRNKVLFQGAKGSYTKLGNKSEKLKTVNKVLESGDAGREAMKDELKEQKNLK